MPALRKASLTGMAELTTRRHRVSTLDADAHVTALTGNGWFEHERIPMDDGTVVFRLELCATARAAR